MTDLKNLTAEDLIKGLESPSMWSRAEIRRRLEQYEELLASYREPHCVKGHPKNFQYGDPHGHFGCAACAMERLEKCEAALKEIFGIARNLGDIHSARIASAARAALEGK